MGIRFFSTLETWHARQTAGDVWEWSGKVVWCFAFYSRIPDRESSICVPRFAIDIPVEKFSRKFFVNETRECGEKAHNRLSLYVNLSQLAVGEAAARRLVFFFRKWKSRSLCNETRNNDPKSREMWTFHNFIHLILDARFAMPKRMRSQLHSILLLLLLLLYDMWSKKSEITLCTWLTLDCIFFCFIHLHSSFLIRISFPSEVASHNCAMLTFARLTNGTRIRLFRIADWFCAHQDLLSCNRELKRRRRRKTILHSPLLLMPVDELDLLTIGTKEKCSQEISYLYL